MSYWGPKKDGFKINREEADLQIISVDHAFMESEYYPSDFAIESELIKLLAKKLYQDGFINFIELNSHRNFEQIIRASIFCVKIPKSKHFLVEKEVFSYQNQNWSEEDIKIALRETFPERFI